MISQALDLATSEVLDIAILHRPDALSHRLAVDEPYMTVYHIECLDVERPVVHTGHYIPNIYENSLHGHTGGSSETGFSGGPVLKIWGRCVETFKRGGLAMTT